MENPPRIHLPNGHGLYASRMESIFSEVILVIVLPVSTNRLSLNKCLNTSILNGTLKLHLRIAPSRICQTDYKVRNTIVNDPQRRLWVQKGPKNPRVDGKLKTWYVTYLPLSSSCNISFRDPGGLFPSVSLPKD